MKNPLEVVISAGAPNPVGPYSQAIRAGSLLFLSGQVPLDPKTNELVTGSIEDQTRRVFANIQAVLESQGLSLANVVKTTVFLTDLAQFSRMNAVYGTLFGEWRPARSTVQVAALPKGAEIEIEVIASYDGSGARA